MKGSKLSAASRPCLAAAATTPGAWHKCAPQAAWVAAVTAGTVTPISTRTGTAGPAISVGEDPDEIAITPDGRTAYVTNFTSGTVTPISTRTNTAGPAIPVGVWPQAIAITPDGRTAYATYYFDGPDQTTDM